MKKYLLSIVTIVCVLVLVGCSSNKLRGKWQGATQDGIKTTWEFKSGDKVSYENEFGITSDGTYKIKDNVVTIDLKTWSEPIDYKFEVKNGKLSLTATNQFSPSYIDLEKK